MNKIILILLFVTVISNAQWVQVSNGIGNTTVLSLAASGSNIFAGTYIGYGVYLTTNNGTSWAQTSFNNDWVLSLAVNGNNIFAGTNVYGLFLSTNSGAKWYQTFLGNGHSVHSLAINGNNIFAGTEFSGVYLSTNNGANWIQTSLGNGFYVRSLAKNGNSIIAGTYYNGIYISTNNGVSWTQSLLINIPVYSLALIGNNIFAATSDCVYLSSNGGANWSPTALNGMSIGSLIVNGNSIFAGALGTGVYVSHDNGANWIQRNEGLGDSYVRSFLTLNNYIFAGTDSGVYRRPIGELIGIQPISTEIPNQFSLSQNYPNPFNPATKIRFALPKNSFTKIIIYDALGREAETIVNRQLNAGTYEVNWNAANYPSGVYYYKLTAGEYTETKKMVLLK